MSRIHHMKTVLNNIKQVIVSKENLEALINDMEMQLKVMMKWLKDSGLTVVKTNWDCNSFKQNPLKLTNLFS